MMKLMSYIYNGCRACPVPQSRVFCCWCTQLAARRTGGGSYCMLIQEYNI